MHPHNIVRVAHDRTTNLRDDAERYRHRTLARSARAEARTSLAGYRAKVAAALRAVAERFDPSRHGHAPDAPAPRSRSG